MMEFVVAFPLVLMLILACIQMTHLILARMVVHYAAYCAARAALISVCDEQDGPTPDNDSWPRWDQLLHVGLNNQYTFSNSVAGGRNGRAHSEAEWYANKAAAQVCAWVVLGEAATETGGRKEIPGWGEIPGSGAADRKTRAIVGVTNWNVYATVEFDFPLMTPIVGPLLAWGADPWDTRQPWMVKTRDSTGNAHTNDVVQYPHLRLTETVWLPKPYKTVIAARTGIKGTLTNTAYNVAGSGGWSANAQDKTIDVSSQMTGRTVTGVRVTLTYEAFSIPDEFQIVYGGNVIWDSGLVSGGRTITQSAPGSSAAVTIRVISNSNRTTAWNWTATVVFEYEE